MYSGARFWKCALQVNPYSYSKKYRGSSHGLSEEEYNEQIVQICKDENIQVVGLADHGNVKSSESLRQVLSKEGITVFPGFEIETTEKIHFVCLFPEDKNLQDLERIMGNLGLTDSLCSNVPSNITSIDLIKKINEFGGFIYAAHVTDDKGLLKTKLSHIWKEPLVRVSQMIYKSIEDHKGENGQFFQEVLKNKNVDYKREKPMVLIHSSDIAEPQDLRNTNATTLIKMSKPSFQSFQEAFKDPESRVRLNWQMKEEFYSKIMQIQIQDGFLDNISIEFSDHLNTIIGGRGTGKSTILECIRHALEIEPKSPETKIKHNEIIKENLGNYNGEITLKVYSHIKSKEYVVQRKYGSPSIVLGDSVKSNFSPKDILPKIEIYGQNEIYDLVKDKEKRSKIIDSFLPQESISYKNKLHEIAQKLNQNTTEFIKVDKSIEEFQIQLDTLPKLEEERKVFQEMGLDQTLERVSLIEKEKNIVERMKEDLRRVNSAIQHFQDELPDLIYLNDKNLESLKNYTDIQFMQEVLGVLKKKGDSFVQEFQSQLNPLESEFQTREKEFINKVQLEEQEIEKSFKNIPNSQGKTGVEIGKSYRDLLKKIESIQPKKIQLENSQKAKESLEQERKILLDEFKESKNQRKKIIDLELKKINKKLSKKVKLNIQFEGIKRPLFEFLLKCNLDRMKDGRLKWIEEDTEITPISLVQSIRDKNFKSEWNLSEREQLEISKLSKSKLLEMESILLEDQLDIELNVSQNENEIFRPIERLSTGQQCTAILTLLLIENKDPLIFDQPEDNLDNAFIADRIVNELRDSKTKRQYIFSTHNANIPVFGDSEWIGILTSDDQIASMSNDFQGFIDSPQIKEQIINILEGGKSAFSQRKEKYGIE